MNKKKIENRKYSNKKQLSNRNNSFAILLFDLKRRKRIFSIRKLCFSFAFRSLSLFILVILN